MSSERADLTELSIGEMIAMMESCSLSSRDLVELYQQRIDAFDQIGPALNSIATVNPAALADAEECDKALQARGEVIGPLHGIPVIIKDQIETRDLRTTFGSAGFSTYVPRRDATLIARLRASGAIVLAKTAMSDFATSWFGLSSLTGETKNPYALDRDPGGSSSGTGAGVAAGLGAVGIGEDTGGSIRVPSSFNNLVGVRVTTGLISRDGMSPLVVFQDTAGPMARSVSDAAAVLDAIVGYDSRDPFTASCVCARPAVGYRDSLIRNDLASVRIGVLRDAFGSNQDEQCKAVNETLERALAVMSDLGATIVEPVLITNVESFIEETTLYYVRSKYDINMFLHERPDAPFHSIQELYASGQFHPLISLFREIAEGPDRPEDDPSYYRKVAAREEFQRSILNTFARDDLDVIVYPTVRIPPPLSSDVRDWSANPSSATTFPTNTVIASHASLPAISMPAGFTTTGLPVGLELLGRPYDEAHLLNLAYAFEQAAQPRKPPAGYLVQEGDKT
jgi:amidase